jgi:hypothetical protein
LAFCSRTTNFVFASTWAVGSIRLIHPPPLQRIGPQDQELQRFREPQKHNRADYQRNHTANVENGTPTVILDHGRRNETAHDTAQVEPVRYDQQHRDTQALRRVFSDKCDCIRHDPAEPDAGNEANQRSSSKDCARAVISVVTAKNNVENTSTGRRPIRSANGAEQDRTDQDSEQGRADDHSS